MEKGIAKSCRHPYRVLFEPWEFDDHQPKRSRRSGQWVTEWYETHITFRYLGTPTEDEMPEYTIGALPNGYAEVDSEREEWPDYICIVYRNEVSGKTIYFDYTRMTQGYVNDFEVNSDTATSSVLVNGMQGYLFQEKNWERQRSSITWIDSDKNLQFTIHAYLPQSGILQMAESVSLFNSTK